MRANLTRREFFPLMCAAGVATAQLLLMPKGASYALADESKSTSSLASLIDFSSMTAYEVDDVIAKQSNVHNTCMFAADSSWIYGPWEGYDYNGEIAKVRSNGTEWTSLDVNTNGTWAKCAAVKDGYLYYLKETDVGGASYIAKVRTSGSGAHAIVSDVSGSHGIQLVGDYIYYTTPDVWNEAGDSITPDSSHFYRCGLEGENPEAILEKPVYYPYVFGDKVMYQDDADNMTLHVYDMETGKDSRINRMRTFWPVYDGSHVYFLSDGEEPGSYEQSLWRMDAMEGKLERIETMGVPVGCALAGGYVYYINADDNRRIYRCRKDGTCVELITQPDSISGFQFIGDNIAYCRLSPDGYIDGFFICNLDGSGARRFCPDSY